MTEQRQAELLAAWLAGERAVPPEGLDEDVVEAVLALHPERAPAPRLTADDILAGVTAGPLAAPAMPPSVQPAPATPRPANRPWITWIALGGSSVIGIAAAGVLTLSVLVWGGSREAAAPANDVAAAPIAAPADPYEQDAVVMDAALEEADAVDTGLDREVARAAPRPRRAPRPAPRPAPRAEAIPEAVPSLSLGGGEGFAANAPAEPDADQERLLQPVEEAAKGGPGDVGYRADAEAEAQAQAEASRRAAEEAARRAAEAAAAAAEARAKAEAEAARQAEEERRAYEAPRRQARERELAAAEAQRKAEAEAAESMAAAAPAAPPPPPPAIHAGATTRSADDDLALEDAEPAPEAADGADVAAGAPAKAKEKKRSTRPRPRRGSSAPDTSIAEAAVGPRSGTAGVRDVRVEAAKARIAAGDLSGALNEVLLGLDEHPDDSRTRQLLKAMQGDIYQASGDVTAAERAWAEAIAIAMRL